MITLPADFVAFWQELVTNHGGKIPVAGHHLIRRWKAGQPVPGYPDESSRITCPPGWSQANLRRFAPRQLIRPAK